MNTKLTRLSHHFLRYSYLNLKQFSHFLHEFPPKSAINEHPLDLAQQLMVH